jgi:hypothetical protein
VALLEDATGDADCDVCLQQQLLKLPVVSKGRLKKTNSNLITKQRGFSCVVKVFVSFLLHRIIDFAVN